MFFFGQYRHNIDEKSRLTIPARYRDVLATEGAYVLQGFDQNLVVFTTAKYEAISRRVNQMNVADPTARLLRRIFFSTASPVELDRAGRILIPQFLRQSAALQGDAMIVGAGDFFEIWSPEKWESQVEKIQDVEANAQRFLNYELAPE